MLGASIIEVTVINQILTIWIETEITIFSILSSVPFSPDLRKKSRACSMIYTVMLRWQKFLLSSLITSIISFQEQSNLQSLFECNVFLLLSFCQQWKQVMIGCFICSPWLFILVFLWHLPRPQRNGKSGKVLLLIHYYCLNQHHFLWLS